MICRRSTKRRTEARNWTLIHVGTLLIALLLGWSAPGAASADTGVDSWPSFRGNARQTGVAAMPLARELELQWAFRMAPGEAPAANVDVGIESTAAIADGSAYVGGLDSQLYAIALGDGKLKWKYATAAPVTASPAVSGGAVFFGDESGLFHAVDAATGKGRWTFATDGKITASANAVEGKVIFGSYDTNLYCLAADTGAQIWRAETEDYVHGSPAVADSVALTAGCDGFLRLIDHAERAAKLPASSSGPTSAPVLQSATVAEPTSARSAIEVLGINLVTAPADELALHSRAERQSSLLRFRRCDRRCR